MKKIKMRYVCRYLVTLCDYTVWGATDRWSTDVSSHAMVHKFLGHSIPGFSTTLGNCTMCIAFLKFLHSYA